jgi:hypothetical protein
LTRRAQPHATAGIDEAHAWQFAIPFTGTGDAQGVSVPGYLDLVYLREADAITAVETSDVLTTFGQELRNQLVQAVADRMISP